jgi:putative ABC transport system permease protein
VSPGYFGSLRIPLVRGRLFTEEDGPDDPGVVVVNRTMARRFWPGEDPLGRRIRFGANRPWMSVVGVVGDVRQVQLETEPREEVYVSYLQSPVNTMTLVARTAGDPASYARTLRQAVRAVDADQPVYNVLTMRQVLGRAVAPRRIPAVLLNLFAGQALVLAAVGIYGVMAYGVSRRRHEIGVRLALGARRADVLRLVVGQGLALALAGVAAGLVLGLGLTRALSGLLYGVSRTDPAVFAGLSALLVAVALLASWLPARRAAGIDPMRALREE